MRLKPNKQWFPILIGVVLALTLTTGVNLLGLNQKTNFRYTQTLNPLNVQGEDTLKASSQDLTVEHTWAQPSFTIAASLLIAASVASAAYLLLNRFIFKE